MISLVKAFVTCRSNEMLNDSSQSNTCTTMSGTWSHLSTSSSDSQHERARHLAIVGQFELGRGGLPHRDFLEHKSVFVLNINTFGTAERLQGELPAVTANIMFFKNRACVRHDAWERHT